MDGYGYANARLRAMKSRLLPPSAYAELLDEATPEDLVAYLCRTPYQDAMQKALVQASGWACLSKGLRDHLGETMVKIGGFFRGDAVPLWQALIGRWQVFNIKTILRGQANHVPAAEVLDALVPVGDLGEPDFTRLVQQTSLRATVDLLATWNHLLARSLLDAMPAYAEHRDLAALELALDRARYQIAFAELDRTDDEGAAVVKHELRREIDATNILTLIRLTVSGLSGSRLAERYGAASPAPLLIPGGGPATERMQQYKELPSLTQLGRDLGGTEFGAALAGAQAAYDIRPFISVFEDEIDARLARVRLQYFRRDPLSIGITIAYLTALVDEVRNLRLIGRCKAAGWKRQDIEKELRAWPN